MARTNRGGQSSVPFAQASTSLKPDPDVLDISQRLIALASYLLQALPDLIGLIPLKMYSSIRTLCLLFLPLTSLASFPALQLPPTTGPYKVGTKTLYLPNAPGSRDLMVSFFYPTIASISTPIAPAFDPGFAAFLDHEMGLPSGLAGSMKSRAYTAAPLYNPKDCKNPPVVLFSPGFTESREEYTGSMSNLASSGYIVVGVDHPNDTKFIQYPDGRNATFVLPPYLETAPDDVFEAYITAVEDRRVSDIRFVLDTLSEKTNLLPGLQGKWDVSRGVGVYGHSLGGASSAATIYADKRFNCGADLDGTIYGPVATKGIKDVPFMIMSSGGYNSGIDSSWASFWKASKGALELEVSVTGAKHYSYSDLIVWGSYLVAAGLIPADPDFYGTIDANRMVVLESAYVTALFDYCTTGVKAKVLKGPNNQFPEAVYNWPK